MSQFVLNSSLQAADDVLAEQTRFVMSQDGYAEFCRLLDEEPVFLPRLREQFDILDQPR